jgi:hypothetical protein
MMLRIEAPHFTAGIVRGGLCAPILLYMKGWTRREIEAYCAERKWTVTAHPERMGPITLSVALT